MNIAIFEAGIFEQASSSHPGGKVPMHIFTALLDTGAEATCITRTAAERVGLTPIGKVPVRGIAGLSFHNNYLFRIGFAPGVAELRTEPMATAVHLLDRPVQGAELNFRESAFDALLGMDILGMGSLKIDGDGSFSFSF